MTQLTPVRSALLTGDEGRVSPTHRIPSAQTCSCSFAVLLVDDGTFEEHKGPVNLPLGGSKGGAFLDWLVLQDLNLVRCCADQQWLREFKRNPNSPNHIISHMV